MKKTSLLFLIIVFFFLTSFHVVRDDSFIIYSNEITFKNKTFKDLITSRKANFIKKFHHQPNAITIEFYKDSKNKKNTKITAYSFLHSGNEERKILNYKFSAATTNDNTVILIKNNPEFTNSLFQIKNEKREFKILYGNKINFCEEDYSIEISNTFKFKKRLWSYELFVE